MLEKKDLAGVDTVAVDDLSVCARRALRLLREEEGSEGGGELTLTLAPTPTLL